MAWTEDQRRLARERRKARLGLRYQSDMTDAEWAQVAPHIPPERSGGRHRDTDMREVVNLFPNAACVVSLVDRLAHYAEIIAIGDESYRENESRERNEQRARQRRGRKP